MPFRDVCVALYRYDAQDDEELTVDEGALLYLLDDTDPDWHKVKLKPTGTEPDSADLDRAGLVPASYIEHVGPQSQATVLYDYEANGDEEITIREDQVVDVLADDDPDWTIVRVNGEAGFVPATYIEHGTSAPAAIPLPVPAPAAEASVPTSTRPSADLSRESHPPTESTSPNAKSDPKDIAYWTVTEVAKKKKDNRKGMLGVGDLMIYYSCTSDKQPVRKWHIDELANYTVKKDVIVLEFAGSLPCEYRFQFASKNDTKAVATKIDATRDKARHTHSPPASPPPPPVTTLSTGLSRNSLDDAFGKPKAATSVAATGASTQEPKAREPAAPGSPEMVEARLGTIMFAFEGEDNEELSVSAGQLVYVLDCTSSPDWWTCQIVREDGTSTEGLVPASYVQLAEDDPIKPPTPVRPTGTSAAPKLPTRTSSDRRASEDNLPLSSLVSPAKAPATPSRRPSFAGSSRPRARTNSSAHSVVDGYPDPAKLRTWVDRSGTFKAQAEFIGLTDDGRVKLHKENGVKIAVPLAKFDNASQAFVKKQGASVTPSSRDRASSGAGSSSGTGRPRKRVSDFEWFDFLTLRCDINADKALRYATTLTAERLDETDIKDFTPEMLHTYGIDGDDQKCVLQASARAQGKKATPAKQVSFGGTSVIAESPAASPASGTPTVDKPRPQAPSGYALSSIDDRFARQRQIEEDELFARKLQETGRQRRKPGQRKPAAAVEDPFDSQASPLSPGLASPSMTLTRPAALSPTSSTASPQPLGLGTGPGRTTSRRPAPTKSAPSAIDPRQILHAQKQLTVRSPAATATSPPARSAPPAQPSANRQQGPPALGFDDQWVIDPAADSINLGKPLPGLPTPTQAATPGPVSNPMSALTIIPKAPVVPLATALPAPLVPTPNVYGTTSNVFVPTREHRAPPPPPAPVAEPSANLATEAASIFQAARQTAAQASNQPASAVVTTAAANQQLAMARQLQLQQQQLQKQQMQLQQQLQQQQQRLGLPVPTPGHGVTSAALGRSQSATIPAHGPNTLGNRMTQLSLQGGPPPGPTPQATAGPGSLVLYGSNRPTPQQQPSVQHMQPTQIQQQQHVFPRPAFASTGGAFSSSTPSQFGQPTLAASQLGNLQQPQLGGGMNTLGGTRPTAGVMAGFPAQQQ
ncbi:cytoskeletal protein binding protein, partial [Tieghemiomyces parasiticus]